MQKILIQKINTALKKNNMKSSFMSRERAAKGQRTHVKIVETSTSNPPVLVTRHVADPKARSTRTIPTPTPLPSPSPSAPSALGAPAAPAAPASTALVPPTSKSKPSSRVAKPRSTPHRISLIDRQKGPSPASVARRQKANPEKTKTKAKAKTKKTPVLTNQSSAKESIITNMSKKSPSKKHGAAKHHERHERQPPGAAAQIDSVRDLQERLLMAQTHVLQWLFVTAKLERATTEQTAAGQRQLYAVWRATEQANAAVASLETLLSAATASHAKKNSLLNETRALRELGAGNLVVSSSSSSSSSSDKMMSSTSTTSNMERHHADVRRAVETKTRDAQLEYQTFANALSSSLVQMPVMNMTSTKSSQNGHVDRSMEKLAQTASVLETALSNELVNVSSLSQEWETLASTVTETVNLLSGAKKNYRIYGDSDEEKKKKKEKQLPLSKDGSGGMLSNAFNRTSRAIGAM